MVCLVEDLEPTRRADCHRSLMLTGVADDYMLHFHEDFMADKMTRE